MAVPLKIDKAAMVALKDYLGVTSEETVLILGDENTRALCLEFFEAAKKISFEAYYLEMLSREHNGMEPPEQVADMMKMVDVVICPTTTSLTHTLARRKASESGVRIATMPGINEDILKRCISADYKKVVALTESVAEKMHGTAKVRVVTKLGTDISMFIRSRKIITSTGVIRKIGEFGNIPSGEVYVAPLEGKTNGVVVFDGSFAGVGLLKNPVAIEIKNGYARKIRGHSEAETLKNLLQKAGRDAYAVGEFGIGTNYKAKLSGNILEDEKVLGTIHIAFGNNITMGGRINVQSHLDGLVTRPTVYFDSEMIMENGKLLID